MKVSNSKERLKEMIQYFGITQQDVCKKSKINKSTLSMYINGVREPRQDQLSKLCDPYGINPTWLMGYDVPMFREDLDRELSDALEYSENIESLGKLSTTEISVIKKLRSADELTKAMVQKILGIER